MMDENEDTFAELLVLTKEYRVSMKINRTTYGTMGESNQCSAEVVIENDSTKLTGYAWESNNDAMIARANALRAAVLSVAAKARAIR